MIPESKILTFMGTELVRLSDVKDSLSYSDRLLYKAIEELKDYHQGQIGPFQWQRRCDIINEAEEYFNKFKYTDKNEAVRS